MNGDVGYRRFLDMDKDGVKAKIYSMSTEEIDAIDSDVICRLDKSIQLEIIKKMSTARADEIATSDIFSLPTGLGRGGKLALINKMSPAGVDNLWDSLDQSELLDFLNGINLISFDGVIQPDPDGLIQYNLISKLSNGKVNALSNEFLFEFASGGQLAVIEKWPNERLKAMNDEFLSKLCCLAVENVLDRMPERADKISDEILSQFDSASQRVAIDKMSTERVDRISDEFFLKKLRFDDEKLSAVRKMSPERLGKMSEENLSKLPQWVAGEIGKKKSDQKGNSYKDAPSMEESCKKNEPTV